MSLPVTPKTLLAKLRHGDDGTPLWQVSWRTFLELYHRPIGAIATGCYRHHTGGGEPALSFIEETVATVIADFAREGVVRYDPAKGRLRVYLRFVINARVVDRLRKERPLNHEDASGLESEPVESESERQEFRAALLRTLIEDLRETVPMRHFEIFERVKLKAMSPDAVAAELGVKRGVVDNTVFKVMTKLRELAASPEYQEEYYA